MSLIQRLNSSEQAAIEWLIHCFVKGNHTGFSHSRRNYLPSNYSWRKPYPETSGYIIENFVKFNREIIANSAVIGIQCADWLCEIQHPEGFYYSETNQIQPSFFNTAQILFGLNNAFTFTQNEKYLIAQNKSIQWLLSCLESSGNCVNGLYYSAYYASYYSRALWPMLKFSEEFDKTKIINSIELLFKNKNNFTGFANMGFKAGENALTHTIAYTLEGFFELGIILDNKAIINHCITILYQWADLIQRDKKLYARYSDDNRPSANYQCATGQAQFISIFCKAYSYSRDKIFLLLATQLMDEMIDWQIISSDPDHHGAFPASIPRWGSYFPFQYVNWTNKFFLDACYQLRRVQTEH